MMNILNIISYDKTINKWTKLYKGIIRKRQFENKLWIEKEKNKILTESLDNYLNNAGSLLSILNR